MQVRKIFVKATPSEEELPEGFYDIVFSAHVTAEELLLPFLVSNYLYDAFKIGYRPQGVKRTRRYMIQTHGNLTVLALIGRMIRSKYRLELPLRNPQLLGNLLIPRFEIPKDHPEYFVGLENGVRILIDGLDDWVKRAARIQSKEEGQVDFRKIFISSTTHQSIVRDRKMREVLRRAESRLPDLA
jgi:hypothetical protein